MSLNYRVVARKIPLGEEQGETKYFGVLKRTKLITYKQLRKQIMYQSSATPGDVSLILDNFLESMIAYLEMGNSVQAGDLGTFCMTAGSRGANTEESFNATYMKTPRVLFRPSPELRARAAQAKFEKVTPEVRIVIGQPGPEEDED
ncbi:MAG: HU family DNA-binding protein [Tannerellaceae bacterium]|nr:HU family DNA-binding protein [Tannerellaceae bacterium]